jgi:hypothetical protein
MKTDALPYYRWLVRDYRSNRKVQRMGYIARGFDRELLDEQWIEGSLPTSMAALAEICQCPVKGMEKAWPDIAPCFDESDGRLINLKLESLRTAQDSTRVKRIEAGRLGGLAKQSLANAKHLVEAKNQMVEAPSNCHIAEQSNSRAVEDACDITPEMVARAVMEELGISGRYLPTVVGNVARTEMNRGRTADEVKADMIAGYQDYEKNAGKLKWPINAEKFFGEGNWRNRAAWPWKEGESASERVSTAPAKPVFEHRSTIRSMDEARAAAGIQ